MSPSGLVPIDRSFAQPTGSVYKNELLGHQPSCVRPLIAWAVPVLPQSGGGGDDCSYERRRQ